MAVIQTVGGCKTCPFYRPGSERDWLSESHCAAPNKPEGVPGTLDGQAVADAKYRPIWCPLPVVVAKPPPNQEPMTVPQLHYFRDLVREALVPRVILWDENTGAWFCEMCGYATDAGPGMKDVPNPYHAKHAAGCRIAVAAVIWE